MVPPSGRNVFSSSDGYSIAVERDIRDGWLFNAGQLEARIGSVLLATVTQDEGPAFVSCREDDDKGVDVHAARSILKSPFLFMMVRQE